MSGLAESAGVLVVYDRESLKVARSIDRMGERPWLPRAKQRQFLDRDLALGAIELSQALNAKRVKPRVFRRVMVAFVRQARGYARFVGVPLPRLTYWPRHTPKRKRRKR